MDTNNDTNPASGEGGHEHENEQNDEAERRATEKYVSDLLARGQAVFEGEEPTSRTTHVVKRADDGRLTIRRLRFLGYG